MKIWDLFAKKHLIFLGIALFAYQIIAKADDDTSSALKIHGFSTLGYSRILMEQNPNGVGYGIVNKSGTTLYNSILGVNLSYVMNDQVTFYGQLTGSGTNFFRGGLDINPYGAAIDMAMLNYHPFDWIDIRIGRQIAPLWMVSEQIDVGVTYAWIRPPMEVYNLAPVKSINGIGADLKYNFFDSIDAELGLRYGDGSYSSPILTGPMLLSRIFVSDLEVKYNNMLKLRASYGTAHTNANITTSVSYLDLSKGFLPTKGLVNLDGVDTFYSVGGSLDWNNFFFISEYAATDSKTLTANAVLTGFVADSPNQWTTQARAWYATAAYHAGEWTPHFTYSKATTTQKDISTSALMNATFNYLGGAVPAVLAPYAAGAVAAIISSATAITQAPVAQNTYTIGLNYNFTPTVVAKAQLEQTRTNDAPLISFFNSPTLTSNDVITLGEVAVSFIF